MAKYIFKNLHFVETSVAHPEQYDVLDHLGRKAGYVRLRHGQLYCKYPDVNGEVIYEHDFDNNIGEFTTEVDRCVHLNLIAAAIQEKKRQIREQNKQRYARMRC